MSKVIINSMALLGAKLRQERRDKGLRQSIIARQAGIGVRFLSELENGKPTAEMGKVLDTVDALGLELVLQPKARAPDVGRAFADVKFKIVGDSFEE